jgi:hypothetical protein
VCDAEGDRLPTEHLFQTFGAHQHQEQKETHYGGNEAQIEISLSDQNE